MSECTRRILSDDYADFIIDYRGMDEEGDSCYETVNERFRILYTRRTETLPLQAAPFGYSFIPKLYGLMANGTESFERTGNYSMQRPPLSLTGRGVVLAFIDTGERVIIWLS